MRLSDAGLRRQQTKLIYPDHRLPPWLNEDATRDRSNRLLGQLPVGAKFGVCTLNEATRGSAKCDCRPASVEANDSIG
jgi:hypothetical protein